MDDTESIAEKYLRHLGYTDLRYEPDGNVPPDFLVDNRIAVEVRRLNQMESTTGSPRGLEEVDIPLLHRITKLLDGFGAPQAERSWFVIYQFSRPVENWRSLCPKIESWLQSLRSSTGGGRHDQSFGTFSLIAVPASASRDREFLVGGMSDDESGGWLLELIRDNAQICIQEKTKKIAARRSQYPEWWLILVDYIGYSLNEFERGLLREQPKIAHNWDRVVLVNPLDHTSSFEI